MPTGDPANVLNLAQLEASAGSDPALMLELVALYLADGEAKLPALLEAAAEPALDRMGQVAHGLKGASAAVGCEEAAGAFRAIEAIGRAGESAGLDDALERVQAAWRRASEHLRRFAA
jgi:HPt (histidine-containing phosphotransfer) domain-containing protein